jgi:hypothetical protein
MQRMDFRSFRAGSGRASSSEIAGEPGPEGAASQVWSGIARNRSNVVMKVSDQGQCWGRWSRQRRPE